MRHQAIRNIHLDVVSIYEGESWRCIDKDNNTVVINESLVAPELARLQAEYDAQEYARNRQAEYPSIAELTVALYDTSDKSALVAKRAAVKAKFPKP